MGANWENRTLFHGGIWIIFLIMSLVWVSVSYGGKDGIKVIANCQKPEGWGFFHDSGTTKMKSEWARERVKNGATALIKAKDGKYEIMILDYTNAWFPLSMRDGGRIVLLRKNSWEAVFTWVHRDAIGIWRFVRDKSGKYRMDEFWNKGGLSPIYKSSVMVSECKPIDFSTIE